MQEAIDKGILTPEGAPAPERHVICRYLGSPAPPDPDFRLGVFNDEGDQHAENNQGLQLRPEVFALMQRWPYRPGLERRDLEVIRSKPNLREARGP